MSNDAAVRPPRKANINFQALGIFIAAAVIFAIFGVLNSNFLTLDNLRDVAVSACVNALIGIGLTFVIITGGIDLSVGSIASFAGIVSANYMVNYGVSPVPALLLGLVLGFAAGAVNGLLITVLKLPAFIATLGTMSVYQGLAYVVTNGTPVYNVPQSFVLLLNSYISGVPIVVVVVVIVAVLAWVLLRRTVFGQNVIATGGSEETAWLSGVRVMRVKILVYGISGNLGCPGWFGGGGADQRGSINRRQPVPAHRDRRRCHRRRKSHGRRRPHRRHHRRRAHPRRAHQRLGVDERAQLLRADCHRPGRAHRGRSRPRQQGLARDEPPQARTGSPNDPTRSLEQS